MAHFDRFDICAAWFHHLPSAHIGNGSRNHGRLSRLLRHYKPSRSEERISGLSENALEILACLRLNDRGYDYFPEGRLNEPDHEIINPNDRGYDMRYRLFRMWAGSATNSGLLGRTVYVWARSFEDAFEGLVDWLDDHAPECLVSHEEAREAYADYIREHYGAYEPEEPFNEDICEKVEQANEWTVIGHTSLKTGDHIRSYEWGGDEVEQDSLEYETVLLGGTEVAREHFSKKDV